MSAAPALYTIRVDGHLGATALSAFPSLSLAAEQECACTVLVGQLDRSALYGVLAQMEMLGLDLLELSRADRPNRAVTSSDADATTSTASTATEEGR